MDGATAADRHARWLLLLSDTKAEAPWTGEGADLVLWLEVLEHHGAVDPSWCEVALYRTTGTGGRPEAGPGRWTVRADAMPLPPGTSPTPTEWPENRFLVQLCQVPDPDLVNEWMSEARKATLDVPLRRELWAEVDTVRPEAADREWGEIHVTRVQDRFALDRIFTNETWLEGQGLLDKVVGASYRMVCRPLVDNTTAGRPLDGV
ncbi:MAG: hypothetical protein AAF480_13720 [Actinomycetota bacterium]